MKRTEYLIFFLITACTSLFFSCTPQQGNKIITEKDLIGSWNTIQGDAESVSFEIQDGAQVFYSYLNQRLFEAGSWQFKKNKLTVQFESGETVQYKSIELEGNNLTLYRQSGEIEQYERLFTADDKLNNPGADLIKQINP